MELTPSRTIEAVLNEFLTEQRRRLSPTRATDYEDVIELLRNFLNGYWPGHGQAEYDRITAAGGTFCMSFGPEEMLEAYGEFLGYYMTHKVIAGKETLRLAGTVMKKLAAWLAEKGYVADVAEAHERAKHAVRELPAATEALEILRKHVEGQPPRKCTETIQDHFTVAHIQPGRLWLSPLTDSPDMIGPIAIPEEASRLLAEHWDMGGVVGRTRQGWVLLEAWNISP